MEIIDKINNILNEEASPNKVQKEVDKMKNSLIKKWKSKGGFENFGQKEVRKLEDKYGSESNEIQKIIRAFDDWAMNYDG